MTTRPTFHRRGLLLWSLLCLISAAWLPAVHAEDEAEKTAKKWEHAAGWLDEQAEKHRELAKTATGVELLRVRRLATMYEETARLKRRVAEAYRARDKGQLEKAHAAYKDAAERLEDFQKRRGLDEVAEAPAPNHGSVGNWRPAEFPTVDRYDDVSAAGVLAEKAESGEAKADAKALNDDLNAAVAALKAVKAAN